MPFYFAWVEADATFGPAIEAEDEKVVGLKLSQNEGGFASLSITVKNPRIGLLAPGRKQWAVLSWLDPANPTAGARVLLFGRIVGAPAQVQDNAVTLVFDARPADYAAQKMALAETLKDDPTFWDPAWLQADRRDDPDVVLEARTALYHTDRTNLEVSVSDILSGEDGLIDFGDDFIKETLDVANGTPPLRSVVVEATAGWDQAAAGLVDISQVVIDAFEAVDSGSKHDIRSLTGDGIMQKWPEVDKSIGGGWKYGPCSIVRTDGVVVPEDYHQVIMTNSTGQFWIWVMKPTLNVAYDVSRPRTEVLSFTLQADCQALLTEPGDEDTLVIKVAANVDELVDPASIDFPQGAPPIGDVRRRSYFPTTRGLKSVDYLLALARSRILARSRAVEVTFSVRFAQGIDLSCSKNARIVDARLPGGEATGKIIGYTLSAADGQKVATVTIGCTIGKGNTVTTVQGEPVYAEEGILEPGIQAYTGRTVMPIAGEVTYEDFSTIPPVDDGVDFFDMRAVDLVTSLVVYNPVPAQQAVLNAQPDMAAALQALNQVFTRFDGNLKKLTIGRDDPPFRTLYPITVSKLMVPKTIDLEGA